MKDRLMHYMFFDNADTYVDKMYALTADKVKSQEHKGNIKRWRNPDKDKESFHGSMEKLYEAYKNGDFGEARNNIDYALKDVALNTTSLADNKWEYVQRQIEGDEVDISRYLDGQEKCWAGCRKRKKSKEVVRVYISCGGDCMKTNKQLAMNGSVAVYIAEVLEANGYNTEIWAGNVTIASFKERAHRSDGIIVLTKLKDSNEYCDLGKIGFFCGQGQFYRTFGFHSFVAVAERDGLTTAEGLGIPAPLSHKDVTFGEEESKSTIIVKQCYDEDSAKQLLDDFYKNHSIWEG